MIFQKLQVRVFLQLIGIIAVLYFLNGCIDQCDTSNSTKLNMAFVGPDGKPRPFKYQMYTDKKERLDTLKAAQTSDKAFLFLDLSQNSSFCYVCFFPDPIKKDSTCEELTFQYQRLPFNKGPECGIDVRIQNLSVAYAVDEGKLISSVKIINPEMSPGNTTNVNIYTSK